MAPLTILLDKDMCGVFQGLDGSSSLDKNQIISLKYDRRSNGPVVVDTITLETVTNRVVSKDPTKFVHISFASLFQNDLHEIDNARRAETERRVQAVLEEGVIFQSESHPEVRKKYLFCGHSNSQLKSRSCFLYAADSHEEVEDLINSYGNFASIPYVEKRAKRIGLLFSNSNVTCELDPSETRDILDVERGGHIFTDGCGLISESFARKLVGDHKKKLNPPELFQNHSSVYIPSVFQIRYKGYKGILVVAKDEEILRLVNEMQKPGFLSQTFSWLKMKLFTQTGQEKWKNTIKVLFRQSMKK
jgi:hypothetical protein